MSLDYSTMNLPVVSKSEATRSVFGLSFLPSIFSFMRGTLIPALVTGNNRNAESMSG
jgi:hypothetical protein